MTLPPQRRGETSRRCNSTSIYATRGSRLTCNRRPSIMTLCFIAWSAKQTVLSFKLHYGLIAESAAGCSRSSRHVDERLIPELLHCGLRLFRRADKGLIAKPLDCRGLRRDKCRGSMDVAQAIQSASYRPNSHPASKPTFLPNSNIRYPTVHTLNKTPIHIILASIFLLIGGAAPHFHLRQRNESHLMIGTRCCG